jgi:hypothetical protein
MEVVRHHDKGIECDFRTQKLALNHSSSTIRPYRLSRTRPDPISPNSHDRWNAFVVTK